MQISTITPIVQKFREKEPSERLLKSVSESFKKIQGCNSIQELIDLAKEEELYMEVALFKTRTKGEPNKIIHKYFNYRFCELLPTIIKDNFIQDLDELPWSGPISKIGILSTVKVHYLRGLEIDFDIECPVDGCSNIKKYNYGKARFNLVCEIEDDQHVNYRHKEVDTRARKALKEKYGTEHALCVPEFKKKQEETTEDRYGKKHAAQIGYFMDKMYLANLEKYGMWYSQTPEAREKIKETNLKKYGMWYTQTTECQEKIKATNLKKYGVEYYTKTEDYRIKAIETREKIQKSAVQELVPLPPEEIKNATTFLKFRLMALAEKEGVGIKDILKGYIKNEKLLHDKFMRDFEVSSTTVYQLFAKLDIEYKRAHQSKMEFLIIEFLREHLGPDIEIIHGSRDVIPPKEIDIWIPDLNLAVEINGVMFHSIPDEQNTDLPSMFRCDRITKEYHMDKRLQCQEKGIQLIQITDIDFSSEEEIRNIQESLLFACGIEIPLSEVENQLNNDIIELSLDRFHKDFIIDGYRKEIQGPKGRHFESGVLEFTDDIDPGTKRTYWDSGSLVFFKV